MKTITILLVTLFASVALAKGTVLNGTYKSTNLLNTGDRSVIVMIENDGQYTIGSSINPNKIYVGSAYIDSSGVLQPSAGSELTIQSPIDYNSHTRVFTSTFFDNDDKEYKIASIGGKATNFVLIMPNGTQVNLEQMTK